MSLKKTVVAAIATASLAVVPATSGWSATPTVAPQSQASATEGYDAKELFQGLFLGHGPVAEKFPNRFVTAPELTPAVAKIENKLMRDYEKAYPGSMDALHDAIESGSYVDVRDALATNHTQLRTLLRDNATKAGIGKDELSRAADSQRNITKFVAVVIAAAGAVAVAALNVAAAANVAWRWNWVWSAQQDGQSTGNALERDRFVVDVVAELS